MRISVRDLITNALDEVGLVKKSQPARADFVVAAFQLLQKRAAQYSNTSLLEFTRKSIDIVTDKTEFIIGEYEITEEYEGLVVFVNDSETLNDMDPAEYIGKIVCAKNNHQCYQSYRVLQDVYVWRPAGKAEERKDVFETVPDFEVYNLQKVTKAYIQPVAYEGNNWTELDFICFEDFYQYGLGSQVYSVLPLTDKCVKILLKKNYVMNNFKIKLLYNVAFDFDIDTVFNIPKQFVSLFDAGLVYDLAVAYPRMSDNTVAILKSRLEELETNVRSSSSVNKFIARDVNKFSMTMGDFIAGRFLGL